MREATDEKKKTTRNLPLKIVRKSENDIKIKIY